MLARMFDVSASASLAGNGLRLKKVGDFEAQILF
jgi:hypothetical protein